MRKFFSIFWETSLWLGVFFASVLMLGSGDILLHDARFLMPYWFCFAIASDNTKSRMLKKKIEKYYAKFGIMPMPCVIFEKMSSLALMLFVLIYVVSITFFHLSQGVMKVFTSFSILFVFVLLFGTLLFTSESLDEEQKDV